MGSTSRKRFVIGLPGANDIDVFEARLAVEPQVREVLPKKPEAFAEKKNGDQRENDDRDERVPAKERLDGLLNRVLGAARFRAARDEDTGVGDTFHATPRFADAFMAFASPPYR